MKGSTKTMTIQPIRWNCLQKQWQSNQSDGRVYKNKTIHPIAWKCLQKQRQSNQIEGSTEKTMTLNCKFIKQKRIFTWCKLSTFVHHSLSVIFYIKSFLKFCNIPTLRGNVLRNVCVLWDNYDNMGDLYSQGGCLDRNYSIAITGNYITWVRIYN